MSNTWPFEPYKIDTGFNKPTSYGTHEGIDLNGLGGGNTDCGYELKAICDGIVEIVSTSTQNYGKLLVIKANTLGSVYYVRYAHCQEILVQRGDTVREGQVVAKMGSTGNSTACHLHLDILKKVPPHWRYYTQSVTDWFVDPVWFIKNQTGGSMPPSGDTIEIDKKTFEELVTKSSRFDAFKAEGWENPGTIKKIIDDLKSDLERERNTNKETAEEFKQSYKSLVKRLAEDLQTVQQEPEIFSEIRKALEAEEEYRQKAPQYDKDRKAWLEQEMELNDEIARLTAMLQGESVLSNAKLEELIGEIIKRLQNIIRRNK